MASRRDLLLHDDDVFSFRPNFRRQNPSTTRDTLDRIKNPNFFLPPRKIHDRDLLLNNECLRVTIAFFFIYYHYYYYYSVPCSRIISIKWFHCVNTSWPLQRLKGLFLFRTRPVHKCAHMCTHTHIKRVATATVEEHTSWKSLWTRIKKKILRVLKRTVIESKSE